MNDLSIEELIPKQRNRETTFWSRYTIAALIIIAFHAGVFLYFCVPASTGHDAHGYTIQAKMIVEHGRVWYPVESFLQSTGAHWIRLEDDRMMSRYPPGLPVVMALIYTLFGPEAVFVLNPVLSSLTLLGLYLLCRFWTRDLCAFVAVGVMAVNPVVNAWVYHADSHFLVSFCLIWGLYCLALWSRTFSYESAFLAGLLLGWIPITRHAETIYGIAIAAYMLMHMQYGNKKYWISMAIACVTAILPLCLLGIHHLIVFGSATMNGYDLGDNFVLFSVWYFQQKFFPYLMALHFQGVGFFAALGFIGYFVLCKKKETRKEGILLSGIAIPTLLLYMAYFFYDGPQRFIMPTLYLYVIAGVWCFHLLFEHQFRGALTTLVAIMIVMIAWSGVVSVIHISRFYPRNVALANTTKIIQETIPEPNAVLIAPRELSQHLHFMSDYTLLNSEIFMRPQRPNRKRGDQPHLEEEGRPDGMMPGTETIGIMERYRHEGRGLAPLLLYDLNLIAKKTLPIYVMGRKEMIQQMIPVNDTIEELNTFEFTDMARGGPPPMPDGPGGRKRAGHPPPPGGPGFGPPAGGPPGMHPPGILPDERRGGPPQGMRPPGGAGRGRPDPVTYSIMKWTRN